MFSLRSLAGVAAVASFCGVSFAAASGPFEVDLIFPRNGITFSATDPVPVVFAVQNYSVAAASQLTILWRLFNSSDAFGESVENSVINSWQHTWTSNEPYFMVDAMQNLYGSSNSTQWQFAWQLTANICNDTINLASTSSWYHVIGNVTYFSTNNSAPAPDLVAATAPGACDKTQNLVFDVAHFNPSTTSNTSCAALVSSPVPTGTPCAVSISTAQAAQLAASVTAAACQENQGSKRSLAGGLVRRNLNCSSSNAVPHTPTNDAVHRPASSVALAVPVIVTALLGVVSLL